MIKNRKLIIDMWYHRRQLVKCIRVTEIQMVVEHIGPLVHIIELSSNILEYLKQT